MKPGMVHATEYPDHSLPSLGTQCGPWRCLIVPSAIRRGAELTRGYAHPLLEHGTEVTMR